MKPEGFYSKYLGRWVGEGEPPKTAITPTWRVRLTVYAVMAVFVAYLVISTLLLGPNCFGVSINQC